MPSRVSLPLREQLAVAICHAISEGRIRPGDRVAEQDLADKFGVSRVPVREAIRILEERGILVTRPKHGTFIVSLSTEEAEEARLFRADLETLALQQALARLSAPAWDALCQRFAYLLDTMRAAIADDAPLLAVQCDREWHKLLVGQCGNRFLFKAWCAIASPMGIWTLTPGYWPMTTAALAVTVPYHTELLAALRRRDPDECRAALRTHILRPRPHAPTPTHPPAAVPAKPPHALHGPFIHLDTADGSTLIEMYRNLVVYGLDGT